MEFDKEATVKKLDSTIDKIFPAKYSKYKHDYKNIYSFLIDIDFSEINLDTVTYKLYHEVHSKINDFFNLHPEINTQQDRTILGEILMSVLAITFQGIESKPIAADSLEILKVGINQVSVVHPILANEDAMKTIHRLQAKAAGTSGYLIRHDKLLALDELLIANDLMDKKSTVCPSLSIESTGQINKVNWKGEK